MWTVPLLVEGARYRLSPVTMKPHVKLTDTTLTFSMYGNSSASLKEWFLHLVNRKGNPHAELTFNAINNVTLNVGGGEVVGIIGLNGAGKSTLLKTIGGIYPPHEGSVEVVGSVTPLIELGTSFDIQLTGRENILINWVMLGRSVPPLKELEPKIIEFAELQEFIDMPVKYYSSGMVARLAFSIATAIRPDILLIDEVFSTGDERFVEKAIARMVDLIDSANLVLFVSHNLKMVKQVCNRVIVMHKGAVVADGSPDEMVRYYLHNIVHGPEAVTVSGVEVAAAAPLAQASLPI
jgi:ABC-type polysaccharide/polyol phosphate transport system ATPase subunit